METENTEEKELKEEDIKSLNARYDTFAWGIFFILVGILTIVPGHHGDEILLGIGIILLGLNIMRHIKRIPTSGMTIIIGVAAFIYSILSLLRRTINIPRFDVDIFPVLLIGTGILFVVNSIKRKKK